MPRARSTEKTDPELPHTLPLFPQPEKEDASTPGVVHPFSQSEQRTPAKPVQPEQPQEPYKPVFTSKEIDACNICNIWGIGNCPTHRNGTIV